ncbi:hypothetical protein [Maribacter sp.]|uniref:hypothetical protein n=1 Tax=Maribacter sp. TaxID=1897614 RepID=UPI0025C010B5|nr:hypothetical protein [Maribacter sp.]
MNTKWYIGTLIIILALIGLNQEQAKVANQQIVLQFTDVEMTSVANHDDALATITKKLQVLGVANIEIIENDSTQLSIRYYSDIDAISVKEFLSHDSELSLAYKDVDQLPFDFPKDKLPENYSLVVSDFQQQTDDGLSLNGKFAFELKQDYKRFSNPIVIQFNDSIVFKQDAIVLLAYKINRVIAIAIDNTSHAIPEVRAGPYVCGNS